MRKHKIYQTDETIEDVLSQICVRTDGDTDGEILGECRRMKEVVVVIPVYTEELTPFEQISLAQAQKVLARYDICFMAPERMRASLTAKGMRAEFWPDACFANVVGYSKLLLTPEFYERFAEYEYMLIYQLDAFVFSDRLESFCDMGYDYIGAPLPYWSGWPYRMYLVGNGGLSLRKISSCIRVARDKSAIYEKTQAQDIMERMEDRFFAYCGWDKSIDFVTPLPSVAITFSMEYDVSRCYRELAKGKLPFGCHGWTKQHNFDRWEKYIRAAGYDLDEKNSRVMRGAGPGIRKEEYSKGIISTLIERTLQDQKDGVRRKVKKNLSWLDGAFLWGNGIRGERIERWFDGFGIEIAGIFDKKVETDSMTSHGHPVIPPDDVLIRSKRHKIIVTPKKYYDEIAEELREKGLQENVDFYSYHIIERRLAEAIAQEKYHGKRFAWLQDIEPQALIR